MSLALINDLVAASSSLRGAMRAADPNAIETAALDLQTALAAVKSVETWGADPGLKARLSDALLDLDSSRMLACLLGDRAGQMQSALASRNPDAPQPLYRPAR